MSISRAFTFGKGINAGYATADFQTFKRMIVEVGFLQILLKTGILGFVLIMILVVSGIFKAINRSQSNFMKYLGVLLAGYYIMLFIENIVGFNLLNITFWLVIGMCHSDELRSLDDVQIKELFMNTEPEKALT
jgi:hypothetical protein